MKSRSAKSKGRRGVVELREAILAAFPYLSPDDLVIQPTTVGGSDLKLSPEARKCWPFDTEVKRQEALRLWPALAQAREHGPNPALVFGRNRTAPWVAVPLPVMLRLLGGTIRDAV